MNNEQKERIQIGCLREVNTFIQQIQTQTRASNERGFVYVSCLVLHKNKDREIEEEI